MQRWQRPFWSELLKIAAIGTGVAIGITATLMAFASPEALPISSGGDLALGALGFALAYAANRTIV